MGERRTDWVGVDVRTSVHQGARDGMSRGEGGREADASPVASPRRATDALLGVLRAEGAGGGRGPRAHALEGRRSHPSVAAAPRPGLGLTTPAALALFHSPLISARARPRPRTRARLLPAHAAPPPCPWAGAARRPAALAHAGPARWRRRRARRRWGGQHLSHLPHHAPGRRRRRSTPPHPGRLPGGRRRPRGWGQGGAGRGAGCAAAAAAAASSPWLPPAAGLHLL